MTAKEKAELLKETIKFLYSNEGRSISYISRLLKIDRQNISSVIHDNGYFQFDPKKAKIQRFIKSNKEFIIARIKDAWTNRELCVHFKVGMDFLSKVIAYCPEIQEVKKLTSCKMNVKYTEIPGEIWKPILGYPNYEVSDYGRCRHIKKGILTPYLNKRHNRFYVGLTSESGERKNVFLHRVVAHAFCPNSNPEATTVNHIDGDTHNNAASNLEWVTQRDNNIHAKKLLSYNPKGGRPLDYIIEYQGKYKFKTITAFAKFINLSESQAKRWIEEMPDKHNIRKIPKR